MSIEDKHYKMFALKLSDRVSSLLKVNFDMKDVQSMKQSYSSFVEAAPNFSYISLYKHRGRGVIVCLNPKMVYVLSNRFLGGKGVIERKPQPLFTFSERFLGRELISWLGDLYEQLGFALHYEREEMDIQRVHYFYPDEFVQTVSMNCKFNGHDVGQLLICLPELDVKQHA